MPRNYWPGVVFNAADARRTCDINGSATVLVSGTYSPDKSYSDTNTMHLSYEAAQALHRALGEILS